MPGNNRIPPKPPQPQGDHAYSHIEDNSQATMKGRSLKKSSLKTSLLRSPSRKKVTSLRSRKAEVLPPSANFLPTPPGAPKKAISLNRNELEDKKAPDGQEESLDSGIGTESSKSSRRLSTDTLYDEGVEDLPEDQPDIKPDIHPKSQAVTSENHSLQDPLPPLADHQSLTIAQGMEYEEILQEIEKIYQRIDDDLKLLNDKLPPLTEHKNLTAAGSLSTEEIVTAIDKLRADLNQLMAESPQDGISQ